MTDREVVCAVPARLDASRFPQKLLKTLNGRPVIWHSVQRALESRRFKQVYCLTDSEKIRAALQSLDCQVVLTGPAENGTDRIGKNLNFLDSDLVVNLQGDEPFFPTDVLSRLADAITDNSQRIYTAITPLKRTSPQIDNIQRIKVAYDGAFRVTDFMRITGQKIRERSLGLQLGAYAYGKDFLRAYAEAPPSRAERDRSHEMLRFQPLPPIQVLVSHSESTAIDVPEDLAKLEKEIAENPFQ